MLTGMNLDQNEVCHEQTQVWSVQNSVYMFLLWMSAQLSFIFCMRMAHPPTLDNMYGTGCLMGYHAPNSHTDTSYRFFACVCFCMLTGMNLDQTNMPRHAAAESSMPQ